jgi:hypothetical protein
MEPANFLQLPNSICHRPELTAYHNSIFVLAYSCSFSFPKTVLDTVRIYHAFTARTVLSSSFTLCSVSPPELNLKLTISQDFKTASRTLTLYNIGYRFYVTDLWYHMLMTKAGFPINNHQHHDLSVY